MHPDCRLQKNQIWQVYSVLAQPIRSEYFADFSFRPFWKASTEPSKETVTSIIVIAESLIVLVQLARQIRDLLIDQGCTTVSWESTDQTVQDGIVTFLHQTGVRVQAFSTWPRVSGSVLQRLQFEEEGPDVLWILRRTGAVGSKFKRALIAKR